MKTKEELEELKNEVESVYKKCRELTPEELRQVTGGVGVFGPGTASIHQLAGEGVCPFSQECPYTSRSECAFCKDPESEFARGCTKAD